MATFKKYHVVRKGEKGHFYCQGFPGPEKGAGGRTKKPFASKQEMGAYPEGSASVRKREKKEGESEESLFHPKAQKNWEGASPQTKGEGEIIQKGVPSQVLLKGRREESLA